MTLHAGLASSGRPRRPGRPHRPRRPASACLLLTTLAALAAAAMAVTGCASSGPAVGSGSGGTSSGGGGTPAKVSLTFQVSHGKHPAFRHWSLRCDPPGGTHPAPAATCASLLKLKNPFAPPKHMNCPMILRSDKRIVVSGTWYGKKVHRVILDGGCDLSLFTKLDQIFH